MKKDTLYAEIREPVTPFEFNESVAEVFDDMLKRSVPLYQESIIRYAQFVETFYQPGTIILDLGCSNGNLGLIVGSRFQDKPFSMIAVDSSLPMIDKYKKRLSTRSWRECVQFVCSPVETVDIKNVSVVMANLIFQFVPLRERDQLIQRIYQGLSPGGILLLTEKVTHENPNLGRLYQDFYTAFKKENGYSDLEISQKREALEGVLIPESINDHMTRVKRIGFKTVDVWLKWFNFVSMICIK